MAYDKIIPIHRRLDHCVDYARNEEKTGLGHALDYGADPAKARLVTGINCDPDCAYREKNSRFTFGISLVLTLKIPGF